MSIENIIDNIEEYRDCIENLYNALKREGVSSFEEFIKKANNLSVPIPRNIQTALKEKFLNSGEDAEDENDWQEAEKCNTIKAYQDYLCYHPNGVHRDEATEKIKLLETPNGDPLPSYGDFDSGIDELLEEFKKIDGDIERFPQPNFAKFDKIKEYIETKKITKEDFLGALKDNNNLVGGKVIKKLIENKIITDFRSAEIDDSFIKYVIQDNDEGETNIKLGGVQSSFNKITKDEYGCTEVYFWGIPSSGKTCALGAILSTANNGKVALSMEKDNTCQGYGYMNRLSEIFKQNGQVTKLPQGTAVNSTYEMGIILNDHNEKEHHITLIDLAGELIRCMYKKDAGEKLDEIALPVLNTLEDILSKNRTKNAKIHFFVIEYGAENKLYEGFSQQTYLEAATRYIEATNIFKDDTIGVNILITKADKLKLPNNEVKEKLICYLNDNYLSFVNGLKKICKKNNINNGNIDILPFTLGQVCFQNYCKFSNIEASKVVKKLIELTPAKSTKKVAKFLAKLKK